MPIDPYRIAQVVKSDVPEMQQISLNAFLNDTHTLLKASEKGSPDISGELPGDAFYEWVDNEKMQVIKVLDDEGRMVGFSCWGFWNYDGSRTGTESDQKKREESNLSDTPEPHSDAPRIDHLGYETTQHLTLWSTRLCPLNERTIYCSTFCVSPAHQGRGVASLMLRWATDRADKDGVNVWVHSSQSAWKVYEKAGFEVVDLLTVNLDDYATKKRMVGQEAEDWGMYEFRIMLRRPQSEFERD